jgi:hypothetical protein
MDVLFTHIKSPFTYKLPPNPSLGITKGNLRQISQNSQIVSIALSIGIAALASRRTNIYGSAALGVITFYASTGVAKYYKIAAVVEKRKKEEATKGAGKKTAPTPEEIAQIKARDRAMADFTAYLDQHDVKKDELPLFLSPKIKEAITEELKKIESRTGSDAEKTKQQVELFFAELKEYYERFSFIFKFFNTKRDKMSIMLVGTEQDTKAGKEIEKQVWVSLPNCATISQACLPLFLETGIPSHNFKLTIGQQELNSDQTLLDLNIMSNAVLNFSYTSDSPGWRYTQEKP